MTAHDIEHLCEVMHDAYEAGAVLMLDLTRPVLEWPPVPPAPTSYWNQFETWCQQAPPEVFAWDPDLPS